MRYSIGAAAIATQLLAGPVIAQEGGSSSAGLTYARAHCAECHVVEGNEDISPNYAAPTFSSVAATQGMTGFAIAAWLRTSHPNMPDLIIAPDDQVNIIAYILSLKIPAHEEPRN